MGGVPPRRGNTRCASNARGSAARRRRIPGGSPLLPAIWLYLRFTLSYRDVEDLLAERGLEISYAAAAPGAEIRPADRGDAPAPRRRYPPNPLGLRRRWPPALAARVQRASRARKGQRRSRPPFISGVGQGVDWVAIGIDAAGAGLEVMSRARMRFNPLLPITFPVRHTLSKPSVFSSHGVTQPRDGPAIFVDQHFSDAEADWAVHRFRFLIPQPRLVVGFADRPRSPPASAQGGGRKRKRRAP